MVAPPPFRITSPSPEMLHGRRHLLVRKRGRHRIPLQNEALPAEKARCQLLREEHVDLRAWRAAQEGALLAYLGAAGIQRLIAKRNNSRTSSPP
jgi:hypothetical protein